MKHVMINETRIKYSAGDHHHINIHEETIGTQGKVELNMMKTAKVKMEQVREENQRLKLTLSQMMEDYQSLEKQFKTKIKEEDDQMKIAAFDNDEDESESLVSLSLGREKKTELGLGLDWKSKFTQASTNLKPDESKEELKNDVGSLRTSPKTSRSGDDDILLQQPSLKKSRVSVRALCNTQTMHDGCHWRKYGQKKSKGNPCPRAYYRCTVSSSCPVRKQVQRCMNDMRVLTTTYEGTHNHALPPSATSMVSATTAAATMLNCGSSTSPPRTHDGVSATSHFGLINNPNFSYNPITISSSSQSHPTVILDLTTPNHTSKLFSSSLFSTPTSFNFSSSNPTNPPQTACPDSIFPNMNVTSAPFPRATSCHKTENDQKIAKEIITRDPILQSALAAAITSFVGRNSELNFNLNFSQQSTTSNGSVGCATSFLNKFPQSVSSQQTTVDIAPLTFMATSKSQAIPLADHEDKEIKLL